MLDAARNGHYGPGRRFSVTYSEAIPFGIIERLDPLAAETAGKALVG
jgi:hypothetical protein